MIIDSDLIVNLGLGQKQRQVQVDDVAVKLESQIIAVVPTSLPVQFAAAGTTVMNYSAVVDSNVNRVNQVALFTTILTLAPGYWEISCSLTGNFNWTHIVGQPPDLNVFMQLTPTQDFIFSAMYAAIGSQNRQTVYRFLIRDEVTIVHEVGLTGVAANTDSLVFVSANRLL